MLEKCQWLNEPERWTLSPECLTVTTDANTDFWQQTQYGFERDSGHFFGMRTDGDFTAQVRLRGNYSDLYDQAGLMVRIDAKHWIKAGVEVSDERLLLCSVLTNPQSDWATGPYDGDEAGFWLRVTVSGAVVRIQYSLDGLRWPLLRLAPFPAADSYLVGPVCCTPERSGLEVAFSEFSVTAPLQKALHDLS